MKHPASSLILVTFVASSLVAGGRARAEDAAAPAPARRSLIGLRCKDDAAKLCAGIEPGAGKLAKCLRTHDADLSEPCKTALATAAGAKAPGGAAAPPAGTPPAAAAAAPAPKADAHPGPMAAGKSGEGAMKGMRKSCAADFARFCKDVKPGHGRIAVCLNEHAAQLAPACQTAVTEVMAKLNAKGMAGGAGGTPGTAAPAMPTPAPAPAKQ